MFSWVIDCFKRYLLYPKKSFTFALENVRLQSTKQQLLIWRLQHPKENHFLTVSATAKITKNKLK